jgi:hypothetical protein
MGMILAWLGAPSVDQEARNALHCMHCISQLIGGRSCCVQQAGELEEQVPVKAVAKQCWACCCVGTWGHLG